MIVSYACDHCSLPFSDKDECADHENQCLENPKNKTCNTCRFNGQVVRDTGKVWNTCDKDLISMDIWKENFRKNCDSWVSCYESN